MARLRPAGAIVLGKTNVAQMLFYFESDNPLYGRTNNPWNPDRTQAAAAAARRQSSRRAASPLGLGTDIGGSLRIPRPSAASPASSRPPAARPIPGATARPFGQRAIVSQVGVLARRVADVALGLRSSAPTRRRAAPPLGDRPPWTSAKLRVAYYTDDGTFPVAPAVRRAVHEAAARPAGRRQVTAWIPRRAPRAGAVRIGIFSADGGASRRRSGATSATRKSPS